MVKHPPALLAWLSWLLVFCSWVIMLGAISALQSNCGGSGASATGGAVDYLAPVSCDKLYRYGWWTTWYQFAMMILIPILLSAGAVHKFRLGLVGLLLPLVVLLMHTANNFMMLWNVSFGAHESGGLKSRSKTMFAGALIGAVADFFIIILVGVHDETA